MRDIFYPKSVAVIGVSSKPDNLGRNIVGNLVEYGFDGAVYAVGKSGGVIETRLIYPTIADVPDPVDLAVILTPARTVPGMLEECGKRGIRRVIIETAGFREYGAEGRLLDEQMLAIANQYGIRFVGPNCIGAINMENGLSVPFPRLKRFVKPGNLSIITQSGGVGLAMLNLMANEGLGLNKFVSVGNMLNINAEDMLEYLIEDPGTHLIFMYLESIGNGRRLMEIARRSPKPILSLKANIGRLGQKIASSHTASLSSDDRVVESAFKQAGIIRVRSATSLDNAIKILELPPLRGRKLAVISRSGGHAVMAADACEQSGFDLAQFPEEFLREIERHFRASVIRLTNPLDLGDLFDLDLYARIIEGTLQLEGIDGVVFLHTSLSQAEHLTSRMLLERIMEMVKRYNKPVAYYLSADSVETTYLKQNYNFPVFTRVVETIRAFETSYLNCCVYSEARRTPPTPAFEVDASAVKNLVEQAGASGRDLLLHEALQALDAYGLPTAAGEVVRTAAEASTVAEGAGGPVVMKVISNDISHKSDVGGVRLNLSGGEAAAAAFDEMMEGIHRFDPQLKPDGVLVQPMVSGGFELILGGRQDSQFGPVVLVGLGGIFVEIFHQVEVRVTPISRQEAVEMIESLPGAQILRGARGRPALDVEAVVDALLRLSQLLMEHPRIQEVDVNPLLVFEQGKGCLAVDARILL